MQKKQQQSDIDESRKLLRSIIRFMKQNQQLSLHELVDAYAETSPDEAIPLSIFSQGLSPSEALCTYLKENRNLSFHQIALLLNRNDRSIWTSYRRAKEKSSQQMTTRQDDILIPISIFQDRSRSIMEHVVHYLRTNNDLTNSRIAELTNKRPGVIATVANRARKKGQ